MTTTQELLKLILEMRILAHEALDLADRCHGGHGYQSIRSTELKKCCEIRMQVDDLKFEFIRLSEKERKLETPKRRSSK